MNDGLSGTAMLIPVVVAVLWWIGRWVRYRGGEVLSRRAIATEIATLALLLLLDRCRASLGFAEHSPLTARLIAAGLLLLFAFHLLALIRSLASVMGERLPLRPPWPTLVLPLLVYVVLIPWTEHHRELDGDEPYFLLIAHSIAYDLDTDLSNNYERQDSLAFGSRTLEPEWADPRARSGGLYSRHNATLPLILAPGYRLAGKAGALLTMASISALTAWMTLALAARLFPTRVRASMAAWALLALTPPFLLYSIQIWTEIPAALLTLVALNEIYAIRADSAKHRDHWIRLIAAVVLLPLLKLRFLLIAGSLGLLAVWRIGVRRRGVVVVVGVLLAVLAGMLAYNSLVFDQALKDHSFETLKRIQAASPMAYLEGGLGLLFDCAFGLFSCNPLWLLLFPAFAGLLVERSSLLGDLLACAVPYLLVVTPRLEWYGAWAPPFRFGIVLLPLLALGLVPMLSLPRRGLQRSIAVGLAVLALALTLVWLVLPGWTYNLADGSSHFLDHLSRSTGTDIGRFFPSYVRPRAASWVIPTLVIPLMLFGGWLGRGWPDRRGLWGATAALTLVAALPLAGASVTTRVVEFEDQQVSKSGGEIYPSAWVPGRPRFRGGWKLKDGDALSAPVNVGGAAARLRIDLQVRNLHPTAGVNPSERADGASVGPREIDAKDGGYGPDLHFFVGAKEVVAENLEQHGGWQTVEITISDWPTNAPFDARLGPSDARTSHTEIVLDRMRIDWL